MICQCDYGYPFIYTLLSMLVGIGLGSYISSSPPPQIINYNYFKFDDFKEDEDEEDGTEEDEDETKDETEDEENKENTTQSTDVENQRNVNVETQNDDTLLNMNPRK